MYLKLITLILALPFTMTTVLRFVRDVTFIGSPSSPSISYTKNTTPTECVIRCFKDGTCVSYMFTESGDCALFPNVLNVNGPIREDYRYFIREGALDCIKAGYQYSPQYALCYKIHTDKVSYSKARENCALEGGKLLRIDSNKQRFVETNTEFTNSSLKYRIDGKLNNTSLKWFYHDGQEITDFYWYPGEPKNNPRERPCIAVNVDYNNKWDNVKCDNEWGYMCEKTV